MKITIGIMKNELNIDFVTKIRYISIIGVAYTIMFNAYENLVYYAYPQQQVGFFVPHSRQTREKTCDFKMYKEFYKAFHNHEVNVSEISMDVNISNRVKFFFYNFQTFRQDNITN